jgi:hypothetical protein
VLKYRVTGLSVTGRSGGPGGNGPEWMRGCKMDEANLDQMLEQRMEALQKKVLIQLEEKAQVWIEEMCKKRMESLEATIRREVEKEAEEWMQKELNNRMGDFNR